MHPNRTVPDSFELKITLRDIRPPIWRRVQVPAAITLAELHKVIQAVMGWEDYHLHEFTFRGQHYGDPANDEFGQLNIQDEMDASLLMLYREAGSKPGFKLFYDYDFGDGWEHEILVEKAIQSEKRLRKPVCIKGKRACPPEDVGGAYGYQAFLEVLRDTGHPEHESASAWIGGKFDPEAFDLQEANDRLKNMYAPVIVDEPQVSELRSGSFNLADALSRWIEGLTPEQLSWSENLIARRDMLTMLRYLQENKVTGTSSRGNFPLKAVRGITAQFVHPPQLDHTIGDHTYKLRSEVEVWHLYFLHILGVVIGVIEGGISQRWKVTPAGGSFLTAPAPVQAWMLFTGWWLSTNWNIAHSDVYAVEPTPDGYKDTCQEALLQLEPYERVELAPFANRIIQQIGIYWPDATPDQTQYLERTFVRNTLLNPLENFELVVFEYEKVEEPYPLERLVAFQLKPTAKALLESLTLRDTG
jgi:hypothetical protein